MKIDGYTIREVTICEAEEFRIGYRDKGDTSLFELVVVTCHSKNGHIVQEETVSYNDDYFVDGEYDLQAYLDNDLVDADMVTVQVAPAGSGVMYSTLFVKEGL